MIGIIDYGMGNLRSIQKAFTYLDYPAKIITRPEEVEKVYGLVIPGVGAFPKAMMNLQQTNFPEAISLAVNQGKPVLGICLGMQLLFECSYEIEKTEGLGYLPGQVKRLETSLKIPHMGWNRLSLSKDHQLWNGLSPEPYLYFVHSFALQPVTEDVIGTTEYGQQIPVAVARENLMGVQFHPEKSGEDGLLILKNFGEMV